MTDSKKKAIPANLPAGRQGREYKDGCPTKNFGHDEQVEFLDRLKIRTLRSLPQGSSTIKKQFLFEF
ncbi:MAG: hypothetical protein A2X59_13490 [Nitrospirae bacterium GWC2_42_7]|nr:MAG: hypothetical protein A2X59_13490 [Nitrospirae bacterium GWC2_42_7]